MKQAYNIFINIATFLQFNKCDEIKLNVQKMLDKLQIRDRKIDVKDVKLIPKSFLLMYLVCIHEINTANTTKQTKFPNSYLCIYL